MVGCRIPHGPYPVNGLVALAATGLPPGMPPAADRRAERHAHAEQRHGPHRLGDPHDFRDCGDRGADDGPAESVASECIGSVNDDVGGPYSRDQR